jgi:uncharacterized protein with von Willebrand factor type A (vWA) domain
MIQMGPQKITKEGINAIVAKAPERPEGSSAFDMTFEEAREAVLKIRETYSEEEQRKADAAAKSIGSRVGAYYGGMVESGMPVELAATLAASYHDWFLDQMSQSADGVRAVRNRGR